MLSVSRAPARFALALLLACGPACVLIPAGESRRLDAAQVLRDPPLAPVEVACRVQGRNPSTKHDGWPAAELEQLFASAFRAAEPGRADARARVELCFHDVELEPRTATYGGVLTLITLSVIPFFALGALRLEARVVLPDGRVLEHSYDRPVWVLAGPLVALWPAPAWRREHGAERVRDEAWREFVLELLLDLRRDLRELR